MIDDIFKYFDESIYPAAAIFRYLGYVFVILLLPRTINFLVTFVAAPFRKVSLHANKDAYAIITGASDGVGLEYARELARRGYNLLLLSRTESKLARVQTELQKMHDVDVQYLSVDFSKIDIYDPIIAKIQALPQKIGVLVNNVGMARHSQPAYGFTEFDDDINRQQLICNTYPITRLSEIVLPIMERQKSGVVINVSSAMGTCPIPYMSVYTATKAYVNALTECLAQEYVSSPIVFQHLTPSHMRTNFQAHSNEYDLLSGSFMNLDAGPWVRSALRQVGSQLHSDGHWIHCFFNTFFRIVGMIVPSCFWLTISGALARRHRAACKKLNARAKISE